MQKKIRIDPYSYTGQSQVIYYVINTEYRIEYAFFNLQLQGPHEQGTELSDISSGPRPMSQHVACALATEIYCKRTGPTSSWLIAHSL